ncbi:MAG: sugar ABC transporter permease [Spirochaetia bacterium]|jgi:multiple sugar transport system permease protein|uniref:Binding-protein-dependent transport system inner membrane protein n=1 Tax=uncultured Spirochaetota bacterium TaxID=460511 RepID=A0A652ZTM8_9SPIR|nr:sugar ABC transporter permease [Spirochaetia bacterium]MCE1209265.1 sugar ABC transporter permease [Spirochaetia bacterium]VBB39124.1 Binding-protein-dependent transport system inner membrane protein [uncultured Spirochaetota bacterium]HOI22427.1 sugar ABC transporter permease [Spirochaetales bacterium]
MLKNKVKDNFVSYLLIFPASFFLILFIFSPIVYSIILSLQRYRLGFKNREFIGFKNYATLFNSPDFWDSLKITAVYTIFVVVISILLGLLLSILIFQRKKTGMIWQITFFLPVAATMAAMAIVWRFILDDNFGFLNNLLRFLGFAGMDWLRDTNTALGVVIMINIWANAGYAMVFFIAGLLNIPDELYQAAALDGSNRFQNFRYISWPLLSPSTLFITVIMTVRALTSFDTIKVMTNGGPTKSTQILSLLLYQEAFQFFNIGYASSIAVVYFILVLFLAIAQMKFDSRVYYQ